MSKKNKKIKLEESYNSLFDLLPKNLFGMIGEFMGLKDLIILSSLNKKMQNLVNNNHILWKNRFLSMRNQLIKDNECLNLKTQKNGELILPCNLNYSESQSMKLRFIPEGLKKMDDLMNMDQQMAK